MVERELCIYKYITKNSVSENTLIAHRAVTDALLMELKCNSYKIATWNANNN